MKQLKTAQKYLDQIEQSDLTVEIGNLTLVTGDSHAYQVSFDIYDEGDAIPVILGTAIDCKRWIARHSK